jgi:LDH2 family malate/lactate/ureidoglycolate dehydrogenase
MLAGSAPVIHDVSNYGLFFLVVDPHVLMDRDEFKANVSELRRFVETNRPQSAGSPVRVPGDGSLKRRKAHLAEGVVTVDDRVYERLVALAAQGE